MDTRMQTFALDSAALRGLSAQLLRSHHQQHYGAAVERLNALRSQLQALQFPTTPGSRLLALKHDELIASNAVLLHELYFDSLGGAGAEMAPALALALHANFGSPVRWREEFVALARALGGGAGWVLLVFQPREGRMVNQWAADPAHAIAGGVPLLALDMDEHAYRLDFGTAAADYVDAFLQNLHWARVYARYQRAVEHASEAFGAGADEIGDALVLDVRRAGVYAQADAVLPGARWRDPGDVGTWAAALPADREVVVYCVYGHEVGRATAIRLRAAGIAARYLRGGIDAWTAAGRPLQPKGGSA